MFVLSGIVSVVGLLVGGTLGVSSETLAVFFPGSNTKSLDLFSSAVGASVLLDSAAGLSGVVVLSVSSVCGLVVGVLSFWSLESLDLGVSTLLSPFYLN